MIYKNYKLFISELIFMLIGFFACSNKNHDTDSFKIESENVVPSSNGVSITGSYTFDETVKGMRINIGEKENLDDANTYQILLEEFDFSVTIGGLKPNTKYYYQYFVDFGTNELYLTDINSFTTLDVSTETPIVKTLEVLAIDSTTFRIKCEVISEGGSEVTERGICWNTYGDPTMDDETIQHSSGGIGQYTLRMEGLSSNTVFHVRAYAKNSAGIGFGEELEFQTGGETTTPVVSTVEMTEIGYNTALCLGVVNSDGNLPILERGACWGLEHDPTINVNYVVAEGTETGNYTVELVSLHPNTTYYVRCYATNEKGTSYGEELSFTTTIGLPTVTTTAITEITSTSAKGWGEVTDQGASNVTERGFCWSTSHEPTISNNHANNGTGTGTFIVNMTGLTSGQTYYVRAYATNTQGTAYGAEVSFSPTEGLPVVITQDITDITSTTAKGHGKVTDQGGSEVSERGVCWSTEPGPTVNDSHATSGTGLGEFIVNLNNLNPGTKYYVRAYAKNEQGTTYGEQKYFTTSATLPTVLTGDINGTTVHGEVTNSGGATVTERGICWDTSHNPTTNSAHGSSGTGTGTFSVELTGLVPGTTYYIRAYATNSAGTAYGSEKTITTAALLPTVTTTQVSNITQTTAQGGGNVISDGGAAVTQRGICWSTSHNPTTSNSHATSGTGTGSYTCNMTGLTAGTTYYVRAYATNSSGTAYGSEMSFTTAQNISAPTVTTSPVTNIQQTTATSGGNVTSDGGATVTQRGICWSTSHNPTTSNSHVTSGTGTGSFTCNMTGLTAGTTYYVRAYAINSAGTAYGSEMSFTTQAAVTVPTVTTAQVTNIQQTTATGGGNVTATGGATVTARGICWSTSHNPTTSNSHTSNGTGTGSFTSNMTGLTAGTTYYVRAYATNSAGTAYGSEVSFITLSGAPQGAINSLFSVSATKQVYFAQGNLQYKASSNTWRFAENQWDFVGGTYQGVQFGTVSGSSNNYISSSYSGWIDLFGFGTSGWNSGATAYQPYSVSQNNSHYFPGNSYSNNLTGAYAQADWAYHNPISNGGNQAGLWRCLTTEEYVYLIQGRANATQKYSLGRVNNINGLIILPDVWTLPSGLTFTPHASNHNVNVYTTSQWQLMESAGAVFLPVTGSRQGTQYFAIGMSGNITTGLGDYWSSTAIDVEASHSLSFFNNNVYQGDSRYRMLGTAVRPVYEVP